MNSIALVGKPNAGKSLLFNKLTGLNQKVTNFPGITVEVKKGQSQNLAIYDFPGIYTFNALTKDENVAIKRFVHAIKEKQIDGIICVLDATQLASSLRLGLEVQHKAHQDNVPLIFAVNMMDELAKNNLSIDFEKLEAELGSPIIPISARTGEGIETLIQKVNTNIAAPQKSSNEFYNRSLQLAKDFGPQTDVIFLRQTKMDGFFLSPFLGVFSFSAIMLILFQAIFSWSAPFMDFVEWSITSLGNGVTSQLTDGIFKDFLNDAIFGGIGSFLVFVPQIFFLTFIVGLLEDSGYLARAAMICHRPLKFFGLSGKSFIPMLTGHACAIPAIYATRTIESPRRRFLTLITVPLMGCSARLPVYSLLVAAFIPASTILGGIIGLQGLVFFLVYFLGIFVALAVSWIVSKTGFQKSNDTPFILELPSYRIPSLIPLVRRSLNSAWQFITKAGTIIFTVTIVIWVLGYFPNGSGQLQTSWLASLGHIIEPLLSPLGLDWKYGVAILTSFLAREVFVGTLGTLFGIEGADENLVGLAEQIQLSGLSFASGVALLVFFAIALQCVSTLAVMKKELGEYRTPISIFLLYSALAYLLSFITYQLLL